MANTAKAKGFGIGAVSRLTGLSVHLLRIWERRYKVGASQRTASGRRMYSKADVERLNLLKTLVDRGDSIGSVAGLDVKELQERAGEFVPRQSVVERGPGALKAAVYGEMLPTQLQESDGDIANLDIIVASPDRERFRADIRKTKLDVLIAEFPAVNPDTPNEINAWRKSSSAVHAVVVYGFARHTEVTRLNDMGITAMRWPVTVNEILNVIGALDFPASPAEDVTKPSQLFPPLDQLTAMQVPARLFTVGQLTRLAEASATIECECPKHLVDLVRSLGAFEVYSQQCEDRNEQDASLHAFLHATSAQARFIIEDALDKLVKLEGLLDTK
ncbi:MAG: MerR family transcriptional regulator [Gammaproteobacteria bacterium]|nr:MerR family transcriptional regulator [Gammaproteobacteria bacterium]